MLPDSKPETPSEAEEAFKEEPAEATAVSAPSKKKKKKKKTNGAGNSNGSATTKTDMAEDQGEGGGDDDNEDEAEEGDMPSGEGSKKKKKKKKSKKKTGGGGPSGKELQQTEPPTIPVSKFFPDGQYPVGEIQEYKDDNLWRTTNEEKRHLDRMHNDDYNDVRRAAEVHRQVRKYAQKVVKPGMTMIDICETIENGTRALVEENGLAAGKQK